jgi:hypothetical protein
MTTPAHIAEREDFRATIAAAPTPTKPTENADAARATRTPVGADRLRQWTSAVRLLAEYDVPMPGAMVEAREVMTSARRTLRDVAPRSLSELGAEALDARDLTKALDAGAKAAAHDRLRAEIASAATVEAEVRAGRALNDCIDEVADGVLGSTGIRQAFDVLAEVAPRIPAGTVLNPDGERVGFRVLADVARAREALTTFASAFQRLGLLGAVHADPDHMGLLYALPSYGTANRAEVDRALRGVRPGALDIGVWTRPDGYASGVRGSLHAPGVTPALLASLRGVTLDLATTVGEFETRVRAFESGPGADRGSLSYVVEDDGTAAGLVL